MSLLTGKGATEVAEVTKGKVDLKEAFIRLKAENESVTVRLLGIDDFVSYKAHGDFNLGIYNSPCLAVGGDDCPYCVAKAKGGEKFEGLYAKNRVVFAFAELNTGQVKCLDVSPNQAKKLNADITEYKEEILDGEIAFNLVRTGSGTSTGYALKPLTPKKLTAVQEKFDAFDGQTVDIEFFEERVQGRSTDYMVKLLNDAGFPIREHFSAELCDKALEDKDAPAETPVTAVEDDGADEAI